MEQQLWTYNHGIECNHRQPFRHVRLGVRQDVVDEETRAQKHCDLEVVEEEVHWSIRPPSQENKERGPPERELDAEVYRSPMCEFWIVVAIDAAAAAPIVGGKGRRCIASLWRGAIRGACAGSLSDARWHPVQNRLREFLYERLSDLALDKFPDGKYAVSRKRDYGEKNKAKPPAIGTTT